mmetsp:Transcript_16101/g.30880  ORF Transcript_16101/g.30880 Transcript_16101/m.30880 type:complete len:495 (-) Transcript_16101:1674-3158(-)
METVSNRKKATYLCLILPFTLQNNVDAFPQRTASFVHSPSSSWTSAASNALPPLSTRRSQSSLELSLVARDDFGNSDFESSADGKSNTSSSSSKFQRPKSEEDVEFDPEDWKPMDFEDVDDFFDSIEFPGYGNNDKFYVEADDPEELLQVLQEMIDTSNLSGNADLRRDKILSAENDEDFDEMDEETILEILGYDDVEEAVTNTDEMKTNQFAEWKEYMSKQGPVNKGIEKGIEDLEKALLGGVVPAEAGVGSGLLPGDCGFDPLELATKDYFTQVQNFILTLLPKKKDQSYDEANSEAGAALPTIGFVGEEDRPPALILRDYREAEIRHGRLAMLAAMIWPLQEILDRIFIPESFGETTVIYGGPTLPFLPLMMTFFMLNLGYLDIYSSEIKENESGDAFLPGECFWDPLSVMEGAPDLMKRNMQEREILNGRAAMIAVAAFIFEEAMTHQPIITLHGNELLFEPAYQVPFIQAWLDLQFGSIGSSSVMFQRL